MLSTWQQLGLAPSFSRRSSDKIEGVSGQETLVPKF
uniref:Uncharacterized protein n=1 Tax=Zea mays TaxID=4577 RepID=B7ZZC9_MAIZE|nr:unknown [Zea mays]